MRSGAKIRTAEARGGRAKAHTTSTMLRVAPAWADFTACRGGSARVAACRPLSPVSDPRSPSRATLESGGRRMRLSPLRRAHELLDLRHHVVHRETGRVD